MSTRKNLINIAKKWITLWCTPVNWELFDQLHAEHFEDCSAAVRSPTKKGFAQGLAELVQAFPDLQTKIAGLVIDESISQVAVRWTAEGTNQKKFFGVGPTNNLTIITGIEIIEIQHGRIIRRWGEWDISGHVSKHLFQQGRAEPAC
jgi:steroid delta-isomerase-like uncharacterized protein